MPPHKCVHEEDFRDLKVSVDIVSNRILIFYGLLTIFLLLVGGSAVQAKTAGDRSTKNQARIDVHEERFKHILEGIQRIEDKLEERSD
jgi:hypothetical protein